MMILFLRVSDKVDVCKKSESFNDKDSFEDNETTLKNHVNQPKTMTFKVP